jgi:hypothetical protein
MVNDEEATMKMRRQRKLFDATKAAVEEVVGPGMRALRRVAALEVQVEQLTSKLEARLARFERPIRARSSDVVIFRAVAGQGALPCAGECTSGRNRLRGPGTMRHRARMLSAGRRSPVPLRL